MFSFRISKYLPITCHTLRTVNTLLLLQFPGTFVVHLLAYTEGAGGGGGEYSLWASENKLGGVTGFVTGFGTRATAVTVWGSINNK